MNSLNRKDIDIFEYLTLRSEFEEIIRKHKVPNRHGTLKNMRWYKKNGHKSNRFREDFDRAIEICEKVA